MRIRAHARLCSPSSFDPVRTPLQRCARVLVRRLRVRALFRLDLARRETSVGTAVRTASRETPTGSPPSGFFIFRGRQIPAWCAGT